MSRNHPFTATDFNSPRLKAKQMFTLKKIPLVTLGPTLANNLKASLCSIYMNCDSSSVDNNNPRLSYDVKNPLMTQQMVGHKQFVNNAAKFSHSFFAERTRTQMKFRSRV